MNHLSYVCAILIELSSVPGAEWNQAFRSGSILKKKSTTFRHTVTVHLTGKAFTTACHPVADGLATHAAALRYHARLQICKVRSTPGLSQSLA